MTNINVLDPDLHWKDHLSNLVTDVDQLASLLELDVENTLQLQRVCKQFPLRVPRPYLSRIKKNTLNDPLLLQVLPQTVELLEDTSFIHDPLQESLTTPLDGLIHKYPGRVLIILSSNCAIHCRYCFRRHFPYSKHQISPNQWEKIISFIENDTSINEVIFSGGDPLSCSDQQLISYIQSLESIHHIKRLRIHTRLPIMIPQRLTPKLISALSDSSLSTSIVVHVNHPNELDNQVARQLLNASKSNITLLNQTVLLHDINNCKMTLKTLSERLFECGVLPYYIHLLDAVQGAKHFHVNKDHAVELQTWLRHHLPGYLVPKFVQEIPLKQSKTPI
jgi:L-lysine 2,3-aminomutase